MSRIQGAGKCDERPDEATAPMPAEIVETLLRLTNALRRRHDARFADRELSGPRMRLLAAMSDLERIRMGDLAARLGLTARTITTLVDALEREGLLIRLPDPTDRRATLLDLTPTGRGYLERVHAVQQELAEHFVAPLSATERRQLHDMLRRLQAASGVAEGERDG
jgi:DNA-binding MarR family transcriptional regulator